jgi:thioredoxin reductase (NADPH)
VENYPGFPDGIMGGELTEKFREQSKRFGTEIFTETVNSVDLSKRPFTVRSDEKEVEAQTVIVATGAVARRMVFPGSGEGKAGYWNKVQTVCIMSCDLHAQCASATDALWHLVVLCLGQVVNRHGSV